MDRLKKRRDFLRAKQGRRAHAGLLAVQALPRPEGGPSRVGFTVSKQVSPLAVRRNRIRRRLKAAVALWAKDSAAPPAMDYVVLARIEALDAPFADLQAALARAFAKASRPPAEAAAPPAGRPRDRTSR